MRVFVSGARGFVARYLIHHLLETVPDIEIVGTTQLEPAASWDTRLQLVCCDLNRHDGEDIQQLIAEAAPDHIYHLAGISSGAASNRDAVFTVNVEGTRHFMSAVAAEAPLARCLFASSGYVYGCCDARRPAREEDTLNPIGLYAESKRHAERFADDAGALIARAFNHTGPGQPDAFVISAFAKQIAQIEKGLQPPQIEVGNLEAQRDFLDVRDIVRGYHAILNQGTCGEIYNICRGQTFPLQEVLSDLLALSPIPIGVTRDPKRMRPDDFSVSVGDPTKLTSCTGWKPLIPFDRTLEETLNWWRAHPLSMA